jgi:hypothetical protein
VVYAVDVGHGQLVDSVRADARVRVHEGLNLRDLNLDHVDGEPVDLIVGDVSFISLTKVLPAVAEVLAGVADASIVAMVKPQFELEPKLVPGGVVRDDALRAGAGVFARSGSRSQRRRAAAGRRAASAMRRWRRGADMRGAVEEAAEAWRGYEPEPWAGRPRQHPGRVRSPDPGGQADMKPTGGFRPGV